MNEIFWIKLLCNTFDDERMAILDQMPECDAIQLMYIKILVLAGKSNTGGYLLLNGMVPYNDEMLAAVMRRPLNVVRLAKATLVRYGYIAVEDDVIHVAEWDKIQFADELEKIRLRKEKDAERKRVERQNMKLMKSLAMQTGLSVDVSADNPMSARGTSVTIDSISNMKKKTTTTCQERSFAHNDENGNPSRDAGFSSITNDLLSRATVNTPFASMTLESLAPSIRNFGINNVMLAVDIAVSERRVPATTPEQYIFGMCNNNGPTMPKGYKPVALRMKESQILEEKRAKQCEEEKKKEEVDKLCMARREAWFDSLPDDRKFLAITEAQKMWPDVPMLQKYAAIDIAEQLEK